jgi:tetratricopeptide (TPR) repeat protein
MADSPRIEELRRRVQMDPASIAFAALAEEYRKAGRFDEAIATCTAGLQRHPAYLSAHVTLGRALIEVGRYDEAREELEHVLRVAPENLAAIRGLAEIHHRRGELPESHEHHRLAEPVAPPPARIPVSTAAPPASPPPTPAPRPAVLETPEPQAAVVTPPAASTPVEVRPAVPAPAVPVVLPAAPVMVPAPAPDPGLPPLENMLAAIVAVRAERSARR